MTRGLAAAGVALCVAVAWASAAPAPARQAKPSPPKSTLAGIYTSAQAQRGEETYNSLCVSCHPRGTYSGVSFKTNWQGKPLLELYEWVLHEMPKSEPGSLTPVQSIQVVGFILQENKMPAGKTPLTTDIGVLAGIKIELK